MSVFEPLGIGWVHHYAPLHYLPYIARSGRLMSKPSLRSAGFGERHLRSMSSKQDTARGFGDCAFLTLEQKPRILQSKLNAGFPHIAIAVPVSAIEATRFSLSRFNIAMTRRLRRDGKPGWPESETNGRYKSAALVPVASSKDDKIALLKHHWPKGTMIEVLVYGDVVLNAQTKIQTYCQSDYQLATRVLQELEVDWEVSKIQPPEKYGSRPDYRAAVNDYVCRALADPNWRGNGLEFDRV